MDQANNNRKKVSTISISENTKRRIQQNSSNKNRIEGPLVIRGVRTKHVAVAC